MANQSFGDLIVFTDFIASIKSELDARQFNIGRTILFDKKSRDYDAIEKPVKPVVV